MSDRTTLLVATSNRAKISEIRALLCELPVELVSVSDLLPERSAITESSPTFEGNATLKARITGEAALTLTLADDSGLEVDALGGRPGVRSARFAHERATDAENNAALLAALAEVDTDHRTARFRCVLAVFDPWAPPATALLLAEGICEGSIARQPRGGGGFGYDPLFILKGTNRTMAELADAEKNRISHRGLAVETIRPRLASLLDARARDAQRICSPR